MGILVIYEYILYYTVIYSSTNSSVNSATAMSTTSILIYSSISSTSLY